MFSQAADLFLIDLPEQGFVPRLGSCAARSSSKQNLTKTVFFDHLQWCLNRSLSSFALNYSVGEPLFAIVPQQEQGKAMWPSRNDHPRAALTMSGYSDQSDPGRITREDVTPAV